MADNICPQCGAPYAADAGECRYCGESLPKSIVPQQQMNQQMMNQQPMNQQPMYQQPVNNTYVNASNNDGVNPAWPIKNKTAAGLLAIFLGGLGIHKFYMGKIGLGILYLVFCWTYIPAFIGFIEGIVYLASNNHNFQVKNHVRIM